MDALGLLELSSIARGYRALDALVKRSPITVLQANLVEPGHYLVLFGGGVAEVEEAMLAGLEVAKGCVLASLQLPMVHEQVLSGLQGTVGLDAEPDTLGIVEAKTVSGGLQACVKPTFSLLLRPQLYSRTCFTLRRTLLYRNQMLLCIIISHRFGRTFSPIHYRHSSTRPVSYYALF